MSSLIILLFFTPTQTNKKQIPTVERQFPFFTAFPPLFTVPFPTLPPFFTTTTPSSSIQTCICVPIGTCAGTTPTNPNDGSGIIDIRIVNNVMWQTIDLYLQLHNLKWFRFCPFASCRLRHRLSLRHPHVCPGCSDAASVDRINVAFDIHQWQIVRRQALAKHRMAPIRGKQFYLDLVMFFRVLVH